MPSSRAWQGLNPGIEPRSPTLQVDSLPSESPGKLNNTGMGSLSLLQWIFATQELNQGLLHCRQILYQLSYQGNSTGYIWQPYWRGQLSVGQEPTRLHNPTNTVAHSVTVNASEADMENAESSFFFWKCRLDNNHTMWDPPTPCICLSVCRFSKCPPCCWRRIGLQLQNTPSIFRCFPFDLNVCLPTWRL